MIPDSSLSASEPSQPPAPSDIAGRIADLEEIAAFLYDLAIDRPEHMDTLFRLSERATAEAEKLRHQTAAI